MATYTKVFNNPYPDGWKNLPSEDTPITAESLQEHTDAVEHIEDYLEENPIGGTDVSWNQLQKSGTKIAEITIDGEMTEVFASQGGGSTSIDYGDKDAFDEWSTTAENGEIFVRTDDNEGGGSGGNANIWYGTHAKYEEQKDSIADGTQVCFTDDVGLEAGSEYYSETEQIIGTYNGKPLYRKCWYNLTTPSADDTALALFTFEHNIVNLRGIMYDKVQIPFSYMQTQSSSVSVLSYANLYYGSNGYINCIIKGEGYRNKKLDVIIEYTKTTDSSVGVINGIRNGDNYSTTEQVIGTWIDGKPLYRRIGTFSISGDHTSDTTMAHNIPDILEITNFSIGKLTSGGGYTVTPYYLDNTWYFNASVSPTSITYRNKGMTGSFRYIFEYTKTTD